MWTLAPATANFCRTPLTAARKIRSVGHEDVADFMAVNSRRMTLQRVGSNPAVLSCNLYAQHQY